MLPAEIQAEIQECFMRVLPTGRALKAECAVEGNQEFDQVAEELDIPFKKNRQAGSWL